MELTTVGGWGSNVGSACFCQQLEQVTTHLSFLFCNRWGRCVVKNVESEFIELLGG